MVYYFSALLFLIGCVASRASIANNLSPYSTTNSDHVALSILLVLTTLGLGIFSYFGLVKGVDTRKLPKSVRRFGTLSIAIGLALALIVLVLFVWVLVTPPPG